MINLYLMRHGHTIWADTGGVAGSTDIDLSDKGREAVRAIAKTFRNNTQLTHWTCSPMSRTQETSSILRSVLEQTSSQPLPKIALDERLVELNFGDWEGQTWDQVHKDSPELLHTWGEDWVRRSPPNGETFGEQCQRCNQWLGSWLQTVAAHHDASAMVVSHGGSIRALLCLCLGWELSDAMTFNVDPASLCWLQQSKVDGPWRVRMINSRHA